MGKILVFGEKYFNYTDSTAEALRKLGYEVKIVYMPVINKIKLGILNYLKYKINKEKFIKNFILSEQEILINIINDYKPNKFLSINGNFYYEYINKRILTHLRDIDCETNLWYMDSIKRCQSVNQHISSFDRIFVFEITDIEYIKANYKKDAYYLPVGFSDDMYKKLDNIIKDIDVSFVGYPTSLRLNILEQVAKFCFDNNKKMVVYGIYYGKSLKSKYKFRKNYPYLNKFVNNELIFGNDVNKLYNRSKICLNIHIQEHKGINPRTFEILAAYAFELCDKRDDFDKFGIVEGTHLVTFKNNNDIIDNLKKYLNDENKRKDISRRGGELSKRYEMGNLLKNFF